MTDESEFIQLQIEHPNTHYIIYNDEKYPINFDFIKYTSKYFYEHRYEISEYSDINLERYDPDENISYFPPEEVIQFIQYLQHKSIQLTNENIITLHYFGHKYKIEQLILSTDKYIKKHEEEICIKFLKRKELQRIIDANYYENKIASNFSRYVNNKDLIDLDIPTLYRILEKESKVKDEEGNEEAKNEFLMKVLEKNGHLASVLFKYADVCAFDNEMLTRLLSEYSNNFEFEFIASSALKAFLNMKNLFKKECNEHLKYKNESINQYEKIQRDFQEQKSEIEVMKKREEEVIRHYKSQLAKYKEENDKFKLNHEELLKKLEKAKEEIERKEKEEKERIEKEEKERKAKEEKEEQEKKEKPKKKFTGKLAMFANMGVMGTPRPAQPKKEPKSEPKHNFSNAIPIATRCRPNPKRRRPTFLE